MPPAVKRLRATRSSKVALSIQQHGTSSISNFTRVSKNVAVADSKNITSTPKRDSKISALTPASRKRKAVLPSKDDECDSDSSADENTPSKAILAATPRTIAPVKRGRGRPAKKSRPAPPSQKRARSPSVSDSDQSINTDKLFKRLRLESSPSRASSPLTADTSIPDSEAERSDVELPFTLPGEVLSLVRLHSSFLKTLTIHYAHDGMHIPADLRVLCPNIARSWGKKRVTEAEIRMCLGVLNLKTANPVFSLADYGRGKICVEVDQSQVTGPLNEKKLNDIFHDNIDTLWAKSSRVGPDATTSFIESLPKAPITICGSVAKAAPALSKGQKRLEEFKQGLAQKKLETESLPAAAVTATSTTTPMNPDGSKMSLLDRIKFKQMQKAALPAGLSPGEMERRAALQRVDEVAALIGMLSRASSSGAGRISFPMSVMLEKLKDSFRMGISREEGATCVRVIAKEVAPEWIRVVTIGGKENVVVETDRQMSKVEAARRVKAIVERN